MTEGNGEVRELPKGWILVQHKDIAEINPKLPFNDLSDDLLVSFLPMAAVEEKSGRFSLSEIREYEKVKKGYTQFVNGDLIFAKITPCMENGKVAIVENLQNGIGFGSTEFHVSRLTSLTSRKYLFYYFVQEKFRRDARQKMTGSAGQLRVSKLYFEEIKIPLAPLLEQERIVEKIEELFSDVDQGVESLKTAQKQLKVYRQAVLKWAFEGKLTEEWRKQQSTLKTGEALLAQIKTERENRYQQQLAEWETAIKEWEAIGKVGKKPTKPKKHKEFNLFNKSEISSIPNSWCWTKLEDITDDIFDGPFGSNLKTEDYVGEGVRVVRLENIEHLNFDNTKKTFVSEDKYKTLERHTVYKGDIIFSSFINEEIRAAILPSLDTTAIAKADCFCIRNKNELISQKWLVYLLSSRNSYNQLITETHGFTRPRINTTQLKQFVVPLCPSAEQEQIVEEIESRLSICDQLEATIIENLQKAEALRQSILKQAFEGRLVPQDPNDEPAEKLLERIKAERQVNGNTGKKSQPSHQQLTLQEL